MAITEPRNSILSILALWRPRAPQCDSKKYRLDQVRCKETREGKTAWVLEDSYAHYIHMHVLVVPSPQMCVCAWHPASAALYEKKECIKRSHYTGMHPELNKCRQARLIPGKHIHPIKDVSQFRTECPINRSNGRRKRRLIRGSTFTRSRTYPSAGLGVQLIVLLIIKKRIASISDDLKGYNSQTPHSAGNVVGFPDWPGFRICYRNLT